MTAVNTTTTPAPPRRKGANRVWRYARRRLIMLPLALWIVVTLAFLLVNVLPGNPAGVIAGPAAGPEQIAAIEERLGLDQSIPQRYADFLGGVVQGDLGNSFYTDRPILTEVAERLPSTLELVVPALLLAALIGLGLGTIGAYYSGSRKDSASRFVVSISQSIPDFLLALLMIYVVFFLLGWAPAPTGRLGMLDSPPERITGALLIDAALRGEWATFRSAVTHSVLPVLTLGFYYSAFFAKTTRAALEPALNSKQVEFARAAGLREWKVIGYAYRQARTPILTYGGILLAALVGGAAIVEIIFSWGGFGEWAIDSILQLDMPAVQGFIVVAGLGTLLTFVLLDVAVAWLDPRISYD